MKTRRRVGREAPRLLLVVAMSAALGACGGGSSNDSGPGGDPGFEGLDDGDFDEDGVPNSADEDYLNGDQDGDGTLNIADPDFTTADFDGDGIANGLDPDFTQSTFNGDYDGDGVSDNPLDLDGDGTPNTEDDDIDGDGTPNDEDDDIDGDGTPNDEDDDADGDGFEEPSAANPCGSAGGNDPDSSNFDWNDNCFVRRDNQFADSLYAAGVQRVVYCSGSGDDNAGGVDGFTDGEYGPNTEGAVTAFQTAYNTANPEDVIGVDGQVGPQTWAALQDGLDLIESAVLDASGGPFFDRYGVQGDRCGDAVLFLNEVRNAEDGLSLERMGWQMTQGASNEAPVPFSIARPFGVID